MDVVKNSHFNTVIFYTNGTCNLKCRYCGIHKSPILKKIDDRLDASFQGDYYFNRVQQYFPRRDMLQGFETWGGEPFLRMDRLHYTLRKLLDFYPFLHSGYSSTNFSYPTWLDQFFGLMDIFGEYPDRHFTYCLQLSIDGPTEINDAGRGAGVTQACLQNYHKLIEALKKDRLPKNIDLTLSIKGTLDNDTLKLLTTKEAIIHYYKFFEEQFLTPVYEAQFTNVFIGPPVPNTAVPSPVTKQDGKMFAQIVKLCREIEQENNITPIFKYYKIITPFHDTICQNCLTYQYNHHTCGTGDINIGLLPDNMVSTCHEGFTQIVDEYTKLAANDTREESSITFDKFLNESKLSLCVTDEEYKTHFYKMQLYNQENTTARLMTSTNIILALAMAGQIDDCFLNEKNALKAAIFMQVHTAYCIKDNLNKTGSYTMPPVGMYKLLLNGAMQIIQLPEDQLKIEEGACDVC